MKKLLLLSVHPEVPETHDNLKQILEDLKLEVIEFLVSADIKMRKYTNIIIYVIYVKLNFSFTPVW